MLAHVRVMCDSMHHFSQVVFFSFWPVHSALCYCSAMSTSSSSGASESPKAKGRGKGRNQSPAMLALKMQKEAVAKNLKDVRSGMHKDSCSVSSVCTWNTVLSNMLHDSIVNTLVSCLRTFELS